ncbi:type I polyketide synthase [Streptomyces pseudogriseolus]|uniref:type I polyketide synthase n=1 Tax=Streptomyces pseudogriseolus TaxID=36817 RepID=UPI003FA27B00
MNEPVPTDLRNVAPGHEPVAVVGLACRLPGADGPAAYWNLLTEGRSAVTDTPDDRRDGAPADGWPLPNGGTAPHRGGFITAPADFDAAFFGISPREADAMDPQARLALELGWEALEHAGIPAASAPRATAVYLGADVCDYADVVRRSGARTGHHTLTGLNRALIANRLSHALGATGPSMTVDSAQSSSLTAVQLACDSLRLGDSELALAGGVHLNLSPESSLAAAQFGALSPDGACHTFDARANGYVRGEGGGIVVLKLLGRALADGDRVYAVIRGGAANNDGDGADLTTPDATAQQAVLRAAYERAGVDPAGVGYVELHGTGTRVGDPVEATALGQVLGRAAGRRAPLAVGSVKTNIGHLEGAAGIAGFLKTVLCLSHGHLVPSLHHERPNPAIDLDGLGLRVQRDLAPWTPDTPGAPLRAGVSSFGMGGTNVHLVLEAAPTPDTSASAPTARTPRTAPATVPWLLSARTPEALRAQAERLDGHVRAVRPDPVDTAWSLLTTRTHLEHRALAVGADTTSLLDQLATVVPAGPVDGDIGRPVFVFPGQGSQWQGMAAELLSTSPVFAERLAACGRVLAPHVDWDLEAVLRGDPEAPPLDRSDVVQPVLWAVMVSLAALWQAHGVRPAAVVGHSQGEIAAACVAGALSLEDAALVVALRSKILVPLEGRSGMVSLALTPDAARDFTARWGDRVTVAALNGPSSTVVSADADTVTDILATAERENVRARRVGIDYASHSAHVEPVRDEMLRLLAPITPRTPDVPFLSTVTGDWLDGPTDAAYWYDNLRRPVLLEPAVRALTAAGHGAFVEVSPHPVLTGPVQDTVETAAGPRQAVVTGTLRRADGGPARFQASLGALWARGADVDWTPVFAGLTPRRVDLPTYAFQRRRHWISGGAAPAPTSAAPVLPDAGPGLPSVGSHLPDTAQDRSDNAPALPSDADALRLVQESTAVVLGHTDPAAVDPRRSFKDLGIDSVTAVELRDRLNALTGRALPATVVYEYPTPARLADRLSADTDEPAGTPSTSIGRYGRSARSDDDPIAIVSMGCRYPGGVRSPEDLWRLVTDGADALSAFPTDRGWDLAGLFDPDPGRTGTTCVREGGFLDGAGEFDAAFFGISPREATAMDPQQRLLLETAWETLERAGIDPRSLHATPTGVFVGATAPEYGPRLHEATEAVEGHVLTGTTSSVASGRIAYALGLEGPAVTVDTACSSSLVALHLAVRALRDGECSLALAAGVTVMSGPGMFVEFSRQRGLAPDGRCKPFSAGADGTNWAEGVGVLLLERLSDARANGHQVLAVVRGSAINQDGASNGLTAPNGPSQERVIRAALADAGVSAADVDVVEAHGTGTKLGDPIEAQALLATYGKDRDAERPLWLGSLKSNIGHTQAASGVAGIIKTVEAMRARTLPRSLAAERPSTIVDWSSGSVELLAQAREWEMPDGRPRRAGVSSFGISGTNAHVILEEPETVAEEAADVPSTVDETVVLPFLVSARSEGALAGQVERLTAHLESAAVRSVDVAWSLLVSRSVFEHRAVLVGGEPVASGVVAPAAGSPVFVFPGQGAQWMGMAVELLESSPVFAERFAECGQALAQFVDWSLTDVVRGEDGAPGLDRVDVVQPVLWAVMVSLAAVWESFGVRPAAVVGHSQGEIAAAVVSGALSVVDGARVVALRSKAIVALAGRGGMVSVALTHEDTESLISRWDGRISVAAVNGPTSTVVSGDADALDELMVHAEESGVRVRRIEVDYASHSAHVESIQAELAELLAPVTAGEPSVPFLSTVTGEWIGAGETDAGYWYRNLRQTVLLEPVVRRLAQSGHGAFLEMSPHPVLTVPVAETVEAAGADAVVVGSLRRGEGGLDRLYVSLGEAWARGVAVDWTPAFAGLSPRRVDLPTYAFQHRRYWLEAPKTEPQTAADPVEEQFWRTVQEGDLQQVAHTLGLEATDALSEVVPALSAWRQAGKERATVDGWRYRVVWQPHELPAAGTLDGTWLLAVPETWTDDELTLRTRDALTEAGADVVRLDVPDNADRVVLAERLAALASPGEPPAGVLSLLALDGAPDKRSSGVSRGLLASMALSQALADTGLVTALWAMTRGAVVAHAPTESPDAGQAAVWGLLRVAGLDDPERAGGLVDLPAGDDAHGLLSRLTALLAGHGAEAAGQRGRETEFAVRAGGVYVRRMVRSPRDEGPTAARPGWKPRGTVLVTGGTGALGAHVARDLAREGAEHLVLTSRRGPDAPGAEALREELTALGCRVTVAACDVADRAALAALLDGVPEELPLTAVVHTAGVVDRARPLTDIDADEAVDLVHAKVVGAQHLHELLAGRPLDAFVLFSSGAGVWGNGGQAPYAAANAHLDALAERRRAAGLPATSIAWGAWAGGGMVDAEVGEQLLRRGVPAMEPGLAVRALREAVADGDTTLVVADIRWDRFVPAYCAHGHRPLIDDVPEVRDLLARRHEEEAAGQDDTTAADGLRGELAALPPAKRRRRLVDLVRTHVATVLGSGDGVRTGKAFRDMGFDSLTAVELRNRLGSALGTRLPATIVFDHPTPNALAAHLDDELFPEDEAPGTVLDPRLREIEAAYRAAADPAGRQELADALRGLLDSWTASPGDPASTAAQTHTGDPAHTDVDEELVDASDEDMFDLIDRELGIS